MKKVYCLFLALAFMTFRSYAYDFEAVSPTGQTLYYNIIDDNNHYVEVTYPDLLYYWSGYSTPTGLLEIPSTVTHDAISFSVTSIGEKAFIDCTGITGIILQDPLHIIGKYSFYGCNGLSSVTIPESITTLHQGSFAHCIHLNTLNYNATNASFEYTNNNYHINPFYDCISLTTIHIGDGVQSLPAYLFYDCHTISCPLIFPSSLQSIGNYAFYYCYNITGCLSFPSELTYVGVSAFYHCNGITSINYNAINCQCSGFPFCLSYNPSSGPDSIVSITIGDNVQIIPDYFFSGLSSVSTLSIPNSVTSIGQDAFNSCSGITSLQIPDNVVTVGSAAFANCTGLVSVELGTNLSVLQNGGGFSSLTLQNLIFNSTNCHLNAGVGPMMFPNCTIENIQIGNNVQYIPEGFLRFSTINSPVVLPEALTSIGEYAFYQCNFVGTLTIPQHVTNIGNNAFAFMNGLSKVTSLPVSAPICGSWTFHQNYGTSNPPLEVPCGCIHDYSIVSGWSNFQNISESTDCTHEISVDINPSEAAGSVQGTGTYHYGSNCTLKAIPHQGYSFINWTKNGTQVSSNPTYHFIVTADIHLIANFSHYDIVDELNNDAISIFPNPTSGIIHIECRGLKRIEIHDATGLRVLMKENTGDQSDIDIQHFSHGVYHIKLYTNGGVINRSIVKGSI